MATTAKGTPYVESSDLVSAFPTSSLALATHIDANLAYNAETFNAQTGTTYSFVLADATLGKLITANNAAAQTFTIPPETGSGSVAWPTGSVLRLLVLGAGGVTIAGGTGVTVNNAARPIPQFTMADIVKTGTDTWTINNPRANKIHQVLGSYSSVTVTNTTVTFADFITQAITPTATNSTIIVIGNVYVQAVANTNAFASAQLVRNTTNLTTAGNTHGNTSAVSQQGVIAMHFYDSPATTSATTYKLQIAKGNANTTSCIAYGGSLTVMEVLA